MEKPKTPRKRKVLDLEEKVEAIELHEKGQSALAISKVLKCGKTQIQEVVNNNFLNCNNLIINY